MELGNTIVIVALKSAWEKARKNGHYTESTVDKTLADVGFIHSSFPSQTMDIVNRKYKDFNDLILLFVDPSKVESPIKEESARSGRPGTFPHIYGPLNSDAVYKVIPLKRDETGRFIDPPELQ